MKHLPTLASVAILACLSLQPLAAEIPPIPRVLPPEGLEIPADVRTRLETRLAATKKRLDAVDDVFLKPDVEIFTKAVELALLHREFYVEKDFAKADWALDEANKRLDSLYKGESPWTKATGLVVRGYRSSIDRSAQPYGLVIPKDHDFNKPCPLYVWLHGRGDKNTDLHFIQERATRAGQITPTNAIVVHPFGRHCVGWKHAGEIDVLEAVASVEGRFKIDSSRVVLIGFSMGGAGAWHIGAHYADRWIAVSPGAGFVDTARYQKITPDKYPADYVQKLWGLYDVPDYVRNLFNTRVIAYSGELDKQREAAVFMEEAYQGEGHKLEHLIGPGVEHKYEPKTLDELLHRLDTVVKLTDLKQIRVPQEVHLQTRTVRYGRMKWVRAAGLIEHWKDSRIDGTWHAERGIELKAQNVSRIELERPFNVGGFRVAVDGIELGDGKGTIVKEGDTWRWAGDSERRPQLAKLPGLQGPIDDAFLSSFLVITPTGKSQSPAFDAWCEFEINHFRDRWRALMRGELPVKRDVDVSQAELDRARNLILWGDPDSNAIIRRLADKLPVKFHGGKWSLGEAQFDASRFAPVFIYPEVSVGKGSSRYLVLNSGLTFREGHDKTNSQQNPKLPDWAIIDITQPPDAFSPGRIHDAGFFNEEWKLKGQPKGP